MFGIGIAEQTKIFLCAFGFGFAVGFLYLVLNNTRKLIFKSDVAVYIQDILFSLLLLFGVFNTVLIINKGELRSYIFLGMFLGFLVGRYSFNGVIDGILLLILSPFFNISKFMKKILKKFKKSLENSM